MKMADFARWLSTETGVSVVVEEALDSRSVTVDILEQSIDDTLSVVARRAGVQITKSGNLYFIGSLRNEDRGILVRRVRRLSAEEILMAVNAIKSNVGLSVSFSDGLLVVADRVEQLTKISQVLDEVENCESAAWVIQLYILDMSAGDLKELGFDAVPSGKISASFAAGSNALNLSSANVEAAFDSVLKFATNGTSSRLVAEPLFLLNDGKESVFVEGDVIPVPVFEDLLVNGQLTKRTSFREVQTGTELKVSLREISSSSARLSLSLNLSTKKGLVLEQAPILGKQNYQSESTINSGGIYLLGSMQRESEEENRAAGFFYQKKKERVNRSLQVWCRAYRVL